jgi:hypothetical protein
LANFQPEIPSNNGLACVLVRSWGNTKSKGGFSGMSAGREVC